MADVPTSRPLAADGFIDTPGPTEQEQDFLARMSHELRTPLNAIQGYTDLLAEDKPPDDPDQPALRGIQRATRRLVALVEAVLDLNQLRTGNFQVAPRTFALAGILHDVARAVQESAQRNGTTVEVAVDQTQVHTDLRMLRQVVFNLADNAVRFAPGGTVVLLARAVDATWFEIVVSDDGIGMTPAQVAAAARPFWQADTSTTRRYDGAGIGLAVCKGLTEAMGGVMDIVSRPGQGARVRLVLPLYTEPTTAIWDDDEPTVLLR